MHVLYCEVCSCCELQRQLPLVSRCGSTPWLAACNLPMQYAVYTPPMLTSVFVRPSLRSHYISYLRRHFMANVAIAGGLLLTLPQGKHDTDGAGKGDAGVIAGGKKKS